jgi:two-component system, OmpR family, phosphate regulon response regulator PhoB
MKKILVVDDDVDILFVIEHLLRLKGFDVRTHPTGLGIPNIVIQYAPDLILLDVMLPGKKGTEVCKELKIINPHIPIILFSANAEQGKAFEIYKADDFVSKPFAVENLINSIKFHVNKLVPAYRQNH